MNIFDTGVELHHHSEDLILKLHTLVFKHNCAYLNVCVVFAQTGVSGLGATEKTSQTLLIKKNLATLLIKTA